MMTTKKEAASNIEKTKFLINGVETKIKDLIYQSPGKDRGGGFSILIDAPRINQHLGNVEYVELFFDGKLIASGWAIVHSEVADYWRFTEVVSYSPMWLSIENTMQGE